MIHWTPILVMVAGYLLGSIPFGLLLARIGGVGDVRRIGSGATGATNVLRTGRKDLAAATLLFDLLKGAAAVLLALFVAPDAAPAAGALAVIGHLYPVWLGFRGGKGAATLMGVALALLPVAGLIYALTWLGSLAATRFSSVSSLLAAVSFPVSIALFGSGAMLPMAIAVALLVWWAHRSNISRLLAGTEPKVGRSKASPA